MQANLITFAVARTKVKTETYSGLVYLLYTLDTTKEYAIVRWDKVPEPALIQMLSGGAKVENIGLNDTGNALKGTSGSLSRLDASSYVIVSRLVTDTNVHVGFRVLTSKGVLGKFKTADAIKLCKQAKARGIIPFQNAIFVDDGEDAGNTAHIKSFPNAPFRDEIIRAKRNKQAVKQSHTGIERAEVSLDKMAADVLSRYNKKQLEQLRLGQAEGLNIALYADPAIDWEKMEAMRLTMKGGYDVRTVAHPDYLIPCTLDCLRYVLSIVTTGADVRSLLNPNYDIHQLGEIHMGIVAFVDVNKYADPSISAASMAKLRKRLEELDWITV